jgi:hypothetical protein
MQDVCRTIYNEKSLVSVEKNNMVVPVKEVFRIQGEDELK